LELQQRGSVKNEGAEKSHVEKCRDQWRIQVWADAPSLEGLTNTWGWSRLREADCLRRVGEFSFKALTFGPFMYENGQKAFSFRGFASTLPQGPETPARRYRLALHVRACHGAPSPLANPGSAADRDGELGLG